MSDKSKLCYTTDAEIERILSLSDEEVLSEHLTEVAEDIFAAYCREVGGTSFEDKPIPPFSDLGERQKQGWRAAAVSAASYQIAHTKKIAEVADLRSQLHGAEVHIALLKATLSKLSGVEERAEKAEADCHLINRVALILDHGVHDSAIVQTLKEMFLQPSFKDALSRAAIKEQDNG